jgi:hypothetical protein
MNFNLNAEPQASGMYEYLSRNAKWLRPAAVTLVAVAVPALAATIDPKLAASFPTWIAPIAAVLGCFGVGLGAAMTDTFSASLVRILGFGACAVILLATIFG